MGYIFYTIVSVRTTQLGSPPQDFWYIWVSSAPWSWARVGTLLQRLCYYLTGMAYIFRFADEYMALATNHGGVRFTRPVLRFVLLCGLCGIPPKWAKTRGGWRCAFVGYDFHWDRLLSGLT